MGMYKITLETSLDTKQLRQQLKQIEGTSKVKIKVDSAEASNAIKNINKDYGNWTSTVTKNGAVQRQTYERIANGIKTVTKLQGDNITVTNRAIKASKTFGEQLKSAFGNLSVYVSAATIINVVKNAIEDMVAQVKELDSSLVELKKVTDLEGNSLEGFTEDAFKLGEEVGRTGREVIDATTVFARSGYDVQDALDLSKVALVMTNVGDGIGDVENAATSLISVLKAYNLEVSDAMYVTDLLNQVSNTSAINFEDLTEGVQRTGAVFAKSDTSIEELTGLLTGANEVMQNIEKTSSGLVTVSQRLRGITKLSDDGYEGISKLSTEFKRIANIDIYDAQGQLRGTFDILNDMAKVFPTLNKNQQQYLAELAAGKRQVTVLQSLLGNWESVDEAVKNATNATGSAMAENEKFLNSVEGKVNQLQSAWQNFSRKSIDSNWVKTILSSGTKIINLFDNMGNVLITLTGIILTLRASKLSSDIDKIKKSASGFFDGLKNISNVIIKYPAAVKIAKSENISLSDSYKKLGISANVAQISIGLVTAALTAGMFIYNKIQQNKQELVSTLKEESENNKNVANSLQSALDEYKKSSIYTANMEDATKKLNEVLEKEGILHSDLGEKINSEKNNRSEVISILKEEINQRQLLAQAKKEEAFETEKSGNIDQSWMGQSWSVLTGKDKFDLSNFLGQNKNIDLAGLSDLQTGWSVDFGDLSGQWGQSASTLKDLNDALIKEIELLQQSGDLTEEDKKKQSAYIQAQSKLQSAIDSATEAYSGRFDMLKSGIDIGEKYENVLINLGIASEDEIDFYKSLIGLSDDEREARLSELDAIKEQEKAVQRYTENLEKYNDSIDKIQDSYSKLQGAIDEYNEYGNLSIDTLQELLSLDSEYLSMLEYQNGQLYINSDAKAALVDKLREEAYAAIESAAMQDLLSMSEKAAGETASEAAGNIIQIGNQSFQAGQLASQGAAGFLTLADAMAAAGQIDKTKVDTTAWANKWAGITNTIKSSISSVGRKRSSGSKRGSSSKSTKDTWKEQFEKEYAALKHQLNMNEITEKEYTDRLEVMYKKYFSNKSKYLDEYNKYEEEVYKNRKKLMEDEIDELEKVLKKQRELAENKYDNAVKVATNAIDERIEALKKQKEALEENNDEQERAIELAKLQDELERAKTQKTQRVFYADRGFVYEADKNAIKEAQKALDDFNAETAKEEQTKAIDAQIEELENLKDGWSNVASNYEMQQARIKAALEMGNNFEEDVLNKRLEYLRNFVNEYNATMDKLGIDEKNLVKYASSLGIDISDKYATGTLYANGGLSLVGEQGAELRVLNQGDGIIPADLTKNLMSWGQMNPVNFFKEMFSPKYSPIAAGAGGSDTIYNFSNLTINSDANNLDALIRDIQIKSKNR